MALNPLDDIIQSRSHSSGRREDRMERSSVKMNARFRNDQEAARAILHGEVVKTLPIISKEPKRPKGISARQWKKQRSAT